MRMVLGVAVLVALACLLIFAVDARAKPVETDLADFTITVTATAEGIEMECARGCAWKTLTFSCGKLPCSSPVDEYGMIGETAERSAD